MAVHPPARMTISIFTVSITNPISTCFGLGYFLNNGFFAELLGVDKSANPNDIKKAYRKVYHLKL